MLIILVLTGFMLWYLLKDHYFEIIDSLKNANYLCILLAVLVYSFHILFDVLSFDSLTKMYSNKVSFLYQVYLGIIYRFFSGVTPLATGGQPMLVYELKKKDISISNGTNICVQAYMVFQVALMILGFIAIILNKTLHLFAYVPFLAQLTAVGFIINFFILILLLCVSFSKNFNKVVVGFFVKILSKLKIIKNKEKVMDKCQKVCDEYYKNAKILLKNKLTLFKCIGFQCISLTFLYLVPFVLSYALKINGSFTWYESISAASYVFMMGCYVPIPGATGGMEYGFSGFFGNFVSGYQLSAFLVSWRTITYYIPLLFGAIVFNIKKNREKIGDNKNGK